MIPGIGNITVSAEFNFHCDPEAAYVVLQNTKCPTYIASWELCLHRAKLDWVRIVQLCCSIIHAEFSKCSWMRAHHLGLAHQRLRRS